MKRHFSHLKIVNEYLWKNSIKNSKCLFNLNKNVRYFSNEPRELGFENRNILQIKDRGLLVGTFPDKT
jgi:hypothetical protein